MKNFNIYSLFRSKTYFTLGLVVFVLLVGISFAWVAYQSRFTINPDAVGYISVAKYYASGDFWSAINAYWSPLVSWLMAPFIAVGFAGQTSFAIVNFLTSLFIMLFGGYLVYKFTSNMKFALLYAICIFPFLLNSLTKSFTPDLLVVAWTLVFIWTLIEVDSRIRESTRLYDYLKLASWLAAVGVIGYFTKLYLQPFFIFSIVGFLGIRSIGLRPLVRKSILLKNLKFAGMILLMYCVFSLTWIVPMSIKYEKLTIGSSYAFNSTPGGLPMTRMIIPVSNDKAVSNWEDPTSHIGYKSINPPPETVKPANKLAHLYAKAPSYLNTIGEMWAFIYVPLVVAAALLILYGLKSGYLKQSAYIIVLSLVYIAGYGVRNDGANHRYLWPVLIFSVLLAIILLNQFFKKIYKQKSTRKLIGGFILASLMIISMFFTYIQNPSRYLAEKSPGYLQNKADELKKEDIIPARSIIVASDFGTATYLGYFLNAKSYGTKDKRYSINDLKTKEDFKRFGIDYYIDFTADTERDYSAGNVVYSSEAPVSKCSSSTSACVLNIIKLKP